MSFPIILKDDEKLTGEVYANVEFETLIEVVGDNVVIEDLMVISPKTEFRFLILVKGKNCIIRNCRFQDFSVEGDLITILGNNTTITNNLFYGSLDNLCDAAKTETIRLCGNGNIIHNNRYENWDRTTFLITCEEPGNLFVNNEFVNSRGGLNINDDNLVTYNFVDGKDKKEVESIEGLGNINRNIKDLKCPDYPLDTHKFKLDEIHQMKKEIHEYVLPEDPNKKKEVLEKPMPDITVKEFMDKLTKRLFLLEREHRFREIQAKMDINVNEYRKLMKELKNIMDK